MDKLDALASITRLSDRVIRVLGQNPGKFTLQGTNTYIIGRQRPFTLIDTGEGIPSYIPLLSSVLREASGSLHSTDPDVGDIIISHRHGDHIGGLRGVLEMLKELWAERNNGKNSLPFYPPRLHKYPLPSTHQDEALETIIETLPQGLYTPSPNGSPFHDLHDGQILAVSTKPESESLQVLYTPGHTVDSIALYLPSDRALYTADTVLGQGTAVFEDLAALIASLRKMLAFGGTVDGGYQCLYPGHGPVVKDAAGLMKTYIAHRLERENQVMELLSSPTFSQSGTPWTTWDLVSKIYAAYPQNLWLPAAHSIDLHLKKLELDGRVKRVSGEGKDTQWVLVNVP